MNIDNLCKLDFLIFSSHKTATQTLLGIMGKNGFRAEHCHTLKLSVRYNDIIANNFLQKVSECKSCNNKKVKITSIVRNPKERLISSFFHSFNDDEMSFLKRSVDETTVSISTNEELCQMYERLVKEDSLPGRSESIDELSGIFGIDIINSLEKKDDYYYLDHDLFEIYIMDFNRLISDEYLKYLKSVLNVEFFRGFAGNLSANKNYYNKYIAVKKMIGNRLDKIIESQFNSFYFTAFS